MRCVGKLQEWAWNRTKSLKAKVHNLDYFFWECTLRCNLNCRHCGSDCTMDAQMPELPAAKVLEVFSDIASHYDAKKVMVAVTGGEPLLRPDLFDILCKVSEMGFPWGIVTNGMLMDEAAVAKCAQAGMRSATVSIDGIGETHNWLRQNDKSYEKATRALALLTQSQSFDAVDVVTCVHRGNVDELDKLYELIRGLGAASWRLFTIFPKGRASQSPEITVDGNLLTQVLSFVKNKRQESPEWPVSYSEEGYLGPQWEREVRALPYYCGAGVHIGSLLCDGSYSACPSLSREWIQGHVDELPFSEAWENRYTNMRERSWMRNECCGSCRDWNNCQASSLHLWDWAANQPNTCHLRMLQRKNQ